MRPLAPQVEVLKKKMKPRVPNRGLEILPVILEGKNLAIIISKFKKKTYYDKEVRYKICHISPLFRLTRI